MMKLRLAATTYGFTLLEMLLVVFLMGMLAVAATAMVDNADEQQRFELTRSRLQQIRYAIVGDTSRTLNGEPVISGFVADMGRLPNNLQELVELGSQPPWQSIDLSSVTPGVTGQIWGGWRGPYLDATPELGSNSTFRDGWGVSVSPVLPNYGWQVALSGTSPDHTDINVQSLGADGAVGGGDFDTDFPSIASGNLVSSAHWQIGSTTMTFNIVFNKPPASDISPILKLRIYFFENTAVEYEDSDGYFGLSGVAAVSGVSPVSVTISPATPLHMGRFAAVVVCSHENDYPTPDANPSNDKLFDGNCADPSTHAPYYFNLLPNTPQPITITIPWNIQ